MSHAIARHWLIRLALAAALVALAALAFGCGEARAAGPAGEQTQPSSSSSPLDLGAQDQPAEEPAPEPQYSHWIVYINDDASTSQSGMTYDIALNLTAKNDSSEPSGKYTGKTVAKTSTTGSTPKGQLNASAIANSSNLQFTLDATPISSSCGTMDDPLAPLVPDSYSYSGSGSISMKAAGTASIGPAAGGFSNTSGQPFTLSGSGSDITMTITIDGKKFKFKGTIRGEE